jgi:uncharacterized protein HemY
MRDERAEGERWLKQAQHDLEFGRLALREGYFAQARGLLERTLDSRDCSGDSAVA